LVDELDRKKVKYPHLTDLAAGKIGRGSNQHIHS
jgi:hypothetical protein